MQKEALTWELFAFIWPDLSLRQGFDCACVQHAHVYNQEGGLQAVPEALAQI